MTDIPCDCQAHEGVCHRKRRTYRRKCSFCIEYCAVRTKEDRE